MGDTHNIKTNVILLPKFLIPYSGKFSEGYIFKNFREFSKIIFPTVDLALLNVLIQQARNKIKGPLAVYRNSTVI